MRVEAPASESSTRRGAGVDGVAASVLAVAEDLAYDVAERGPARVESELVRFVHAAQRHGADVLLGSIVLDRSEPEVTRQRAFGAMHHQVARQIGDT
jgi:hypothetical protein